MVVFARDELPSEEKLLRAQMKARNLPIALVFNNQPAREPGQHWLAIYGVSSASNGGAAAHNGGGLHINIELFDFNSLPQAEYSLHSNFKSIVHCSQVPFQSPNSALCVHYCLYFLFARLHGYSFPALISRLTHHNVHPRTPDEHV